MRLFEQINENLLKANLIATDFMREKESQEYDACRFKIEERQIHFRKAKVTPKKEGLFVTFWKRIPSGVIAPFEKNDDFDFLIIEVKNEIDSGWFIFPKTILMEKNIISTSLKEGKRGFRIYPPSSGPKSKQGFASQKWQMLYFSSFREVSNLLNKIVRY
ncbi:MepB family protein [Flavobacterium antarcticum]|uniref:MepB family protein n=1 Tax=Flavobacterium antarcticum TaxID=271155 RepID=UPI0003B6DB6A|nr:MepB family protein [Flavobacterium antarcticum]